MSNIRVKDPATGHEYDVPPSRLVVCPDLIVLDKPTGRTKPRLPLGTPLPGGQVDRRRSRANQSSADTKSTDQHDGQSVATEKE